MEALSLARYDPPGSGGRRLQILREIHLPQFHQDTDGTGLLVENPRIDDPHDVLMLENEKVGIMLAQSLARAALRTVRLLRHEQKPQHFTFPTALYMG